MMEIPQVPNGTTAMDMPGFGPEMTKPTSDMFLQMNANEEHAHHPLHETPALMYFFVICLSIQSFTGSLGNLLVSAVLNYLSKLWGGRTFRL